MIAAIVVGADGRVWFEKTNGAPWLLLGDLSGDRSKCRCFFLQEAEGAGRRQFVYVERPEREHSEWVGKRNSALRAVHEETE